MELHNRTPWVGLFYLHPKTMESLPPISQQYEIFQGHLYHTLPCFTLYLHELELIVSSPSWTFTYDF